MIISFNNKVISIFIKISLIIFLLYLLKLLLDKVEGLTASERAILLSSRISGKRNPDSEDTPDYRTNEIGCENYECKVDDNGIYVHKELNAEEIASDDNENYRLCNNFPEYSSLYEEDANSYPKCSNEICCENIRCDNVNDERQEGNKLCGNESSRLLPLRNCYSKNICDTSEADNACCAPLIDSDDGISTLFREIYNYSNPNNPEIPIGEMRITPLDYRNYIYSTLLTDSHNYSFDGSQSISTAPTNPLNNCGLLQGLCLQWWNENNLPWWASDDDHTITKEQILSDDRFKNIGGNLERNIIWNNLISNYSDTITDDTLDDDDIKKLIINLDKVKENQTDSYLDKMFKTTHENRDNVRVNLYQFRELIKKQ